MSITITAAENRSMDDLAELAGRLAAIVEWCVENEGQCLGDHQHNLTHARDVLADAKKRYNDKPSGLDMLMDRQPEPLVDGSQVWFAVTNPKAVRGQPMALFRLMSDAQLVGGRMTLGEIKITPVVIKLPDDVEQPNAPMPPVTLIG